MEGTAPLLSVLPRRQLHFVDQLLRQGECSLLLQMEKHSRTKENWDIMTVFYQLASRRKTVFIITEVESEHKSLIQSGI